MTEHSAFEKHLEHVLLVSHVALAIHRVTHPGCADYGHLTELDERRAEAAIDAMTDQDHRTPGGHLP